MMRNARAAQYRARETGVSLVELAIVLLMLGILMRAAIQPLGARLEARRQSENATLLQHVKDALTGYLILHGRLPCPGQDRQAPVGDGQCLELEGGIDAARLGLAGSIDDSGSLLDAWGTPLRYRVADASSSISICRVSVVGTCPARDRRVDDLVFVVLSEAKDRTPSVAQMANVDGDALFVQTAPSIIEGQAFDDELIWMSASEQAYWLLQAGHWTLEPDVRE